MKSEKYSVEALENVFNEQQIQFPFDKFYELVRKEELRLINVEAAKPKFKTKEIHNIHPLPEDSTAEGIEEFIVETIEKNADEGNYHDFFYDYEGLPDEGVDKIDYYKVGDKLYEIELHCSAEWVSDWSVRKNLPGDVSIGEIKEVKDFTISADYGDYIVISIPA